MIKLSVSIIVVATVLNGLISFVILRNHFITTLLRLEFASLSLYLLLFLTIVKVDTETFISLIYLALAACEGALGLSILVAVIKHRGNDFLNSANLIQC
jgi:NADH:ubiquinone oxidoreductase subunit K